ncbi:hypothetical protein J6590_069295 [Homalodisca vitripennis]|nr:hypothetical protein J6590_069295 [Homalodisca vitripennis]
MHHEPCGLASWTVRAPAQEGLFTPGGWTGGDGQVPVFLWADKPEAGVGRARLLFTSVDRWPLECGLSLEYLRVWLSPWPPEPRTRSALFTPGWWTASDGQVPEFFYGPIIQRSGSAGPAFRTPRCPDGLWCVDSPSSI